MKLHIWPHSYCLLIWFSLEPNTINDRFCDFPILKNVELSTGKHTLWNRTEHSFTYHRQGSVFHSTDIDVNVNAAQKECGQIQVDLLWGAFYVVLIHECMELDMCAQLSNAHAQSIKCVESVHLRPFNHINRIIFVIVCVFVSVWLHWFQYE